MLFMTGSLPWFDEPLALWKDVAGNLEPPEFCFEELHPGPDFLGTTLPFGKG
jgi:hypothetical protein